MGDELRDVVKGYLAKIDVDGLPPSPSLTNSGESQGPDANKVTWQKGVRWCPKELLELVNSKACRGTYGYFLSTTNEFETFFLGAIMFNDTLTLDQCVRLVEQLSETALPFQCAHGRFVKNLHIHCYLPPYSALLTGVT